MRTRSPIRTSLSIAVPRPITVPAPMTDRSRTKDWSPRITSSAIRAPARTTAPQQTAERAPITSGGGGSFGAEDVRASFGGLPRTAPSWITQSSPTIVPGWMTTWAPITTESGSSTPSPTTRPGARSDSCMVRPPGPVERRLRGLEDAHDTQTALAVRARGRAGAHAVQEVLALDAQRLAVRDPRAVDVARAGDVLAVAGARLVEALVVDRDLALEVHVVELG